MSEVSRNAHAYTIQEENYYSRRKRHYVFEGTLYSGKKTDMT